MKNNTRLENVPTLISTLFKLLEAHRVAFRQEGYFMQIPYGPQAGATKALSGSNFVVSTTTSPVSTSSLKI